MFPRTQTSHHHNQYKGFASQDESNWKKYATPIHGTSPFQLYPTWKVGFDGTNLGKIGIFMNRVYIEIYKWYNLYIDIQAPPMSGL